MCAYLKYLLADWEIPGWESLTVTKIWDYVTNASNNFSQEIRGKDTK